MTTESAVLSPPCTMRLSSDIVNSAAACTPTDGRPIRVCHVSLTLKTGGLERLLADFSRLHDRERYQLEFLALREVGRFAEIIQDAGCRLHTLKPSGRWEQVRQLARIFRERQFDVVHTHNIYPHLYGTLAARWARTPVVIQTRHGQRSGHGWKSSLQYRWAAKLVDRVVAVSHDAARLTVAADGIPTAKVETIWNGIDLDAFEYRGPGTMPIAVAVARLSAEKDFPTLLEAVKLARAKVPELRLRLIGDGPERVRLEAIARELGLDNCVEFHGDCRNVPEKLAEGAMFVSSSITEGISLTILEAMALGLPVIATAVGGNPEIVVDGVTGRLVPAKDPVRFAEALVNLCQRPNQCREWGLAGRNRVEENFDVRRMVADYQNLYASLLADSRRGARIGK